MVVEAPEEMNTRRDTLIYIIEAILLLFMFLCYFYLEQTGWFFTQ